MRRTLSILLAIALAVTPLLAATYYVDQSAGNDANAGTSAGSPWKNCPGMYGLVGGTNGHPIYTGSGSLTAGDSVYFDSADTWQVSNEGTNNGAGCGLLMVAGVTYIGNEWPSASSKAKIEAYGYCESGIVRMNADHATIPNWIRGFEITAISGVVTNMATGVDINGGYWVTGLTDAMKIVSDCYVHDLEGNGSSNFYKYGIWISDGSTDASGWVANVIISNNIIARPARDGLCFYPGANGRISNCVAVLNTVYGNRNDNSYPEGHGLMAKGDVRNSKFLFNVVSNVNSSAMFINGPETGTGPGPTNLVVMNNILETQDNNGVIRIYGTGTGGGQIVGNIVKNNETTGILSMNGYTDGPYNWLIAGNTFMGFVDLGNPGWSGTHTLSFSNNIVYEVDDPCLLDTGTDITDHGKNLYFKVNGGTVVSSGGSTYTAATITSYESSALASDPVFKSVSNVPFGFTGIYGSTMAPDFDGLSLMSSSPAIDYGADLGAALNVSINTTSKPQGGGWDIGAYEYVASSAVTYQIKLRGNGLKVIR